MTNTQKSNTAHSLVAVILSVGFIACAAPDEPDIDNSATSTAVQEAVGDCSASLECASGTVISCTGTNSQCSVGSTSVTCNGAKTSCPSGGGSPGGGGSCQHPPQCASTCGSTGGVYIASQNRCNCC